MNHFRPKIALIGAGNIGGEIAALCMRQELGDVVLFDIPEKEGLAKGKALDLMQAAALYGYDISIQGSSQWSDCKDADVVIVTAGVPRKPGMSRDDLLAVNLKIIREVARQLAIHCPQAFVIIVSNPLDAMVYEAARVTGFPKERVVGMAGILDSSRFQCFLAAEAQVSFKDVRAMVLGGHGDSMVPVPSYCTINGISAKQFISDEKMKEIVQRTANGGGEIVKLMGTSAYYAPAAAAVVMAESYLLDQKRLLPCAAYVQGEYGLQGLYIGVPVLLGKKGVERIMEISLTSQERELLHKSAAFVQELIEASKRL